MPLPDSAATGDAPLYPPIEPYASGQLAVDGRHMLYWETCGNPHGVPVVFLHGGPGGGSLPHHRRFFVPRFWRNVVFAQTGAGGPPPPPPLPPHPPAPPPPPPRRRRPAPPVRPRAAFA